MNKDQKITIEKYLDNELSEQELSLFVDSLREDPELLEELNLAIEMKGLAFCAQHDSFKNLESDIMNTLSQEKSPLEDSVMAALPSPSKVTAFPSWLKVAVAAQIILIPLFLFILKPTQNSVEVAPVLIAQVNEVKNNCFVIRGEEKINIKSGQHLFSDDQIFVQDESSLKMSYMDGSTLSFSSQSFVRLREINDQKIVELFSGVLDANIQKQAPGKDMIISTEHSECEVIGTKFSLSSSDVSALLDVSEGAVRYNKAKSTESVMVKANHYASTNHTQNLKLAKSTKPLYKSPEVNYHTPNKRIPIDVDLHGARSLYLVVSNANGKNLYDHSAWINPKITGPAGEISLTE